jgi:HSP20 family protein
MSDRNRNRNQVEHYLRPRAAVNESTDGKLRVLLEMPGVRREELEIRIENNELRVVGRRARSEQRKYLLRERVEGSYVKTYTLDETVDQSKIDAMLDKGILTITLDLKEQVKPRTIQVRGE